VVKVPSNICTDPLASHAQARSTARHPTQIKRHPDALVGVRDTNHEEALALVLIASHIPEVRRLSHFGKDH
jgi:hypothetical protein